jgi:hypothetical protein
MAIKDFIVKNGLQVTSNVLVGDYVNTVASDTITNGLAASGNVGVGTSTVRAGDRMNVVGGNVNIQTNGFGLVFPDGTYMTTAATSGGTAEGGTGAIQYADGTDFAGDNTLLYFDGISKIGIGTNDVSEAGFHAKTALPALFDTTSGTDRQLRVGNSATTAATLGYDPGAITGYLRADPAGTSMITWSAAGVGINGITAPLNTLDVAGGTVIGSGLAYAGSATAPTDGLLVQGAVGVGTVSAGTNVKLGIYGGNLVVGGTGHGIVFSNGSYQTIAFNSTSAVTSFSAGTTGLTPNSATTGDITLAGTLAAANGGTGQSSYTIGDLLYASGSTALSKLAGVATGNVLISGGVGTAPSWGKVGLTTHVTGTLPVANGGTNSSTASGTALDNITGFSGTGLIRRTGAGTYTFGTAVDLTTEVTGVLPLANGGTNKNLAASNGGIVYTDADSMEVLAASATSGNVLISGGAGAPSWGQYYTSSNVPSSIVSRDASGNFSAGTITAATGLTVSAGGATVTGASQFNGNVSIAGNLILQGNAIISEANVLVISDPIIYLGEQNPGNVWDLGIVGAYTDEYYKHTGLLHRHTDGKWVLFDNLITEPGETINWEQPGLVYDDLLLGSVDVVSGNVDISGAGKGIIFPDDSFQTTAFSSTSAVTSFSAGTTGLTPNSATTGAVTLSGTLVAANGGTGQSSYTTGDLLYASGSTALSKLVGVPTGNALISGGTATAPSWGKIGLTTHVTGTLPVANGGTNSSSASGTALDNITGFTGTGLMRRTGAGTYTFGTAVGLTTEVTGTLPATNGGTGQSTVTTGDILYGSAADTWSKLAGVATGNVLISGGVGTAPSWGKVGLTTHVTGTLPVANGGTNSSSASGTALDNITGFSGTGLIRRTGAGTYTFGTAVDLTTEVTGTLPLANGGTNKNLTASNGGVVYTDADSMEVLAASATSGNVLISGGAGAPSWGQYYTDSNVASSIVSRDASGNFAGNAITANTVVMTYTVDVTGTHTTAASTSQVTIDTFAGATYRAAEYQISMKAGTNYAISRLTVIHDGETAYLTEYDAANTNGFLVNFDANYNAGTIELKAAPTNATITELKISRKMWVV